MFHKLVLTHFHLTKSCNKFVFQPEAIAASFLHLVVFISQAFIEHFSNNQSLVPLVSILFKSFTVSDFFFYLILCEILFFSCTKILNKAKKVSFVIYHM